jgi:hypothetical protein
MEASLRAICPEIANVGCRTHQLNPFPSINVFPSKFLLLAPFLFGDTEV